MQSSHPSSPSQPDDRFSRKLTLTVGGHPSLQFRKSAIKTYGNSTWQGGCDTYLRVINWCNMEVWNISLKFGLMAASESWGHKFWHCAINQHGQITMISRGRTAEHRTPLKRTFDIRQAVQRLILVLKAALPDRLDKTGASTHSELSGLQIFPSAIVLHVGNVILSKLLPLSINIRVLSLPSELNGVNSASWVQLRSYLIEK
jgi:hypothetical protein